jgi:serine/threonine protein kinase
MEHDMEEAFFENARVDAVAMERLTASPYIINIYGFCGMTVVTEYAGEEVSDVARERNSTERLKLAIKVAQGVADIHSIDPRPSLAHNDLNLANLRVTADGRPVLNDFNIAVLLMKHNITGETCPFVSRFPNPQWRAPEEQVYSQHETDTNPPIVTEKIDIYALGNVLYRLAVGASPWKKPGSVKLTTEEKLVVAELKRTNGTQPNVPDDIPMDSAVQVMLEAMRQTYRFRPRDRPTASAVVEFLKQGLERIQ